MDLNQDIALISKSCLALSLIRTPLVSQEFGVMRPPGVGGVFGIAPGCFGTSKGSRVFRQVKTAYLIDGACNDIGTQFNVGRAA